MEFMKSKSRAIALWSSVFLVGLMGGCSSGAHSAASRPPESSPPTDPVQIALLDCKSSMECCIKKFPMTAAQSCGATPEEIAKVLIGAEALNEVQHTEEAGGTQTEAGAEVTQSGEDAEAAAERKRMPKWKRKCIDTYYECIQRKWIGSCYDCFRRCEGQHEWPEDMCYDPRERN